MIENSQQAYWSEEDWENIFKKDDTRIRAYMSDLPRYLDLPNEDAILMTRMANIHHIPPPDPITWNSDFMSPEDTSEEEEEEGSDTENFEKYMLRDGAGIYQKLRHLSMQWNLMYACDLPKAHAARGQIVMCYYAAALARTEDLLDIDATALPALCLALCLRAHKTLQETYKTLSAFPFISDATTLQIEKHKRKIQELIDDLNSTIYDLRHSKNGGPYDSTSA